jgi:Holliday junction DNA helicase RuvA
MIAYLEGKTIYQKQNHIILQVGGVGYKIFTKTNENFSLGEQAALYIHEQIKEDSYDLFGFSAIADLELFEKLISVNGVGPKAGISILSIGSAEKIISSIESQDFAFFEAVPGIGKKVAAKIIIELKSKLENLKTENMTSSNVVEALVSLGFKKPDISKVISEIPVEITSDEEKVRFCLKHLSNFK